MNAHRGLPVTSAPSVLPSQFLRGQEERLSFLPAGGTTGALIRAIDWSNTALGPVEEWPQSLRTSISICLNSRFPMLIWWGPSLVKIYNDAYIPMLGAKHPRALGQTGREVWPEIWHIIGPMLEGVMQRGEATWSEDTLLPLERKGFTEECYFTFSYSPINTEDGGIGGVFTAVSETSAKVIGERRLDTLRELGALGSNARTAAQAAVMAARVLSSNVKDLPFSLIYLLSSDGTLVLEGMAGFDPMECRAPKQIPLSGADSPLTVLLREALENGHLLEIDEPMSLTGILPQLSASQPVKRAGALRIAVPNEDRVGILIVGISPRLSIDDNYRSFIGLVAGQLGSAISAANAYEAERKRAEALAEIDRAKTTFFSNISHEFRTPIALMLGPLEDNLADPHPDSARNRQRDEIAHRNALRLEKLVNTLLEFSRIEAGRVTASFRRTNLGELTQELASVFRASIEKAGLQYTVRTSEVGGAAYIDREMWEKIVLNLLSNALKFTFEGEIEVSLTGDSEAAVLTVRDTGTGIPAAELPHVFDRFHRVAGTVGRTQEGSGIGLALIQELVRLHGGTIGVRSEMGQGTVFEVRVPLGKSHLPPEYILADEDSAATGSYGRASAAEAARWLSPAELPTPSTPTSTERRSRILLADDNADMRAYLKRLLTDTWDVQVVSDGEEAFTVASNNVPDLILSDVMMPKLDGFGLIARLRQNARTKNVPVLLLSARAGEESRIEGLRAGADDYLVKPFSAKELLARIQTHLQIGRFKAVAERERTKLSAVFAQAPVGIALLEGPEHVFSIANPVYCSMLFGGPRDFVGKRVRDAIPESVSQGFVALLDRVYHTGEAFIGNEMPIDLVQQDGIRKRFFLDFVYQPLRGTNDDVQGIVAVIHDVTDRVASRLAIEDSEKKYRILTESLPQLVWTWRADGRCDYVSQQWLAYTGAEAPSHLDLGWLDLAVHPDDRERVYAHWMGAVAGEHGYDIEFRIRRHDDTYRWFKARATPIGDAGHISSWFGTCTDIQEGKEIEAKLAFERHQLETIFQRSPAAMALWVGPDLVFEKVNPHYQSIFPDRELLGRPFLAACPEFIDQPFPQMLRHVLKTGEEFTGREVLARHSDTASGPPVDHYYDFTYLRINDADGNPYGVYDHATDVTDRVRDRLSLEDNKQRLEQSVAALELERELRERFVATLSHDLRTPLQSVTMSAQLIRRKLSDSDVAQQLAGRIIENIRRADSMIRNLLDANRVKAGERLAIETEHCELNEIVEDTLAELATLHGDRFVLKAESKIQGHWSKGELRRVLENLCGNAIKYGDPYRPVEVILIQVPESVRIEVHNEGNPIAPNDREKLFQPFKRLGAGQPAGGAIGWGLGLTLVKGIVEAHGGCVDVHSEPDTGTVFTVTLPYDSRAVALSGLDSVVVSPGPL